MTKTTSNTPRTISVRRDRSFLRTEYELLCSDVSGTGRLDDVASGFFLATDALVVSLVAPSLTRDSTPSIRIAHKPIQKHPGPALSSRCSLVEYGLVQRNMSE